ncbi:MAG TPA: hypothetical protein VFF73_23665 [Planctomycetota bacterium]|nr:hypothetical protein [Planctomycetota bacterium]
MSRGLEALLELPAETVQVVRTVGPRFVLVVLWGLATGAPFAMGAGFCLAVTGEFLWTPWPDIALSFVIAHPVAWLGISVCLAGVWAGALFAPLRRLTRPGAPYCDARIPGVHLLYLPVLAAYQLPAPDPWTTWSLEYLPAGAIGVQFAGLVIALVVVLIAATTFALAPAAYVSDPSLGVRAALCRSRELARGRRALFVTVSSLPAALVAAGIVAATLGERLTLGGALLPGSAARTLAIVAGLACIAIAPTLSAALKTAALNIATRAG